MLKVGITGGIGSGKSTVCQVFKALGIPVFDADVAARHLMEHDADLVSGIKKLFGDDIYVNSKLDRKKLADIVFDDPGLLQQLNALVHPATIRYGEEWMNTQSAPYAIKEAAIFFESGSDKGMDVMVGVSAPLETRISRAMKREHISREKVMSRVARQMDEEEKMAKCDHVIINDGIQALIPQVLELHNKFTGQ